jgi:hypothetical protein
METEGMDGLLVETHNWGKTDGQAERGQVT